MKTTLTIALIFSLSLSFTAKSTAQPLTEKQKSFIEKQVDSVFRSMIKAAESLDYDKLARGVDDKHRAGFILNNTYYAGFDSMVNVARAQVQRISRQTITLQKEKIAVITSNIALVSATGQSKVDTNSGSSFTITFFWSFVYEKTGNNWKIIQSHQSTVQ